MNLSRDELRDAAQRGEQISRFNGTDYVELTPKELCETAERPPSNWTADDYARLDGTAYSLYNRFAELQEPAGAAALRIECAIQEPVLSTVILEAASLYWSALASKELREGSRVAGMDWLHEAYDALELAAGIHFWDCATQLGREEAAARTAEATAARRAIGADSRDRLEKVAADYRGRMSRDAAAPLIAAAIGKAPSTVRRRLSQAFPGDLWDASNDHSRKEGDQSR